MKKPLWVWIMGIFSILWGLYLMFNLIPRKYHVHDMVEKLLGKEQWIEINKTVMIIFVLMVAIIFIFAGIKMLQLKLVGIKSFYFAAALGLIWVILINGLAMYNILSFAEPGHRQIGGIVVNIVFLIAIYTVIITVVIKGNKEAFLQKT